MAENLDTIFSFTIKPEVDSSGLERLKTQLTQVKAQYEDLANSTQAGSLISDEFSRMDMSMSHLIYNIERAQKVLSDKTTTQTERRQARATVQNGLDDMRVRQQMLQETGSFSTSFISDLFKSVGAVAQKQLEAVTPQLQNELRTNMTRYMTGENLFKGYVQAGEKTGMYAMRDPAQIAKIAMDTRNVDERTKMAASGRSVGIKSTAGANIRAILEQVTAATEEEKTKYLEAVIAHTMDTTKTDRYRELRGFTERNKDIRSGPLMYRMSDKYSEAYENATNYGKGRSTKNRTLIHEPGKFMVSDVVPELFKHAYYRTGYQHSEAEKDIENLDQHLTPAGLTQLLKAMNGNAILTEKMVSNGLAARDMGGRVVLKRDITKKDLTSKLAPDLWEEAVIRTQGLYHKIGERSYEQKVASGDIPYGSKEDYLRSYYYGMEVDDIGARAAIEHKIMERLRSGTGARTMNAMQAINDIVYGSSDVYGKDKIWRDKVTTLDQLAGYLGGRQRKDFNGATIGGSEMALTQGGIDTGAVYEYMSKHATGWSATGARRMKNMYTTLKYDPVANYIDAKERGEQVSAVDFADIARARKEVVGTNESQITRLLNRDMDNKETVKNYGDISGLFREISLASLNDSRLTRDERNAILFELNKKYGKNGTDEDWSIESAHGFTDAQTLRLVNKKRKAEVNKAYEKAAIEAMGLDPVEAKTADVFNNFLTEKSGATSKAAKFGKQYEARNKAFTDAYEIAQYKQITPEQFAVLSPTAQKAFRPSNRYAGMYTNAPSMAVVDLAAMGGAEATNGLGYMLSPWLRSAAQVRGGLGIKGSMSPLMFNSMSEWAETITSKTPQLAEALGLQSKDINGQKRWFMPGFNGTSREKFDWEEAWMKDYVFTPEQLKEINSLPDKEQDARKQRIKEVAFASLSKEAKKQAEITTRKNHRSDYGLVDITDAQGLIDESLIKNAGAYNMDEARITRLLGADWKNNPKYSGAGGFASAQSDAISKAMTNAFEYFNLAAATEYQYDKESSSSIGGQMAKFLTMSPEFAAYQQLALTRRFKELETNEGKRRYVFGSPEDSLSAQINGLTEANGDLVLSEDKGGLVSEKVAQYKKSVLAALSSGELLNTDIKTDDLMKMSPRERERWGRIGQITDRRLTTNPMLAMAIAAQDSEGGKEAHAGGDKTLTKDIKLSSTMIDDAYKFLNDYWGKQGATKEIPRRLVEDMLNMKGGIYDFENADVLQVAGARAPNGFGQYISRANYAALMKPYFDKLNKGYGMDTHGLFLSEEDKALMSGADLDADEAKMVYSNIFRLNNIARKQDAKGNWVPMSKGERADTLIDAILGLHDAGSATKGLDKFMETYASPLTSVGYKPGYQTSDFSYGIAKNVDIYNAIRERAAKSGKDIQTFGLLGKEKELDLKAIQEQYGIDLSIADPVVDPSTGKIVSASELNGGKKKTLDSKLIFDESNPLMAMVYQLRSAEGAQKMGLASDAGARLSMLDLSNPINESFAQTAAGSNRLYDIYTTWQKKIKDVDYAQNVQQALSLGDEFSKIMSWVQEAAVDQVVGYFKDADGNYRSDEITDLDNHNYDIANGVYRINTKSKRLEGEKVSSGALDDFSQPESYIYHDEKGRPRKFDFVMAFKQRAEGNLGDKTLEGDTDIVDVNTLSGMRFDDPVKALGASGYGNDGDLMRTQSGHFFNLKAGRFGQRTAGGGWKLDRTNLPSVFNSADMVNMFATNSLLKAGQVDTSLSEDLMEIFDSMTLGTPFKSLDKEGTALYDLTHNMRKIRAQYLGHTRTSMSDAERAMLINQRAAAGNEIEALVRSGEAGKLQYDGAGNVVGVSYEQLNQETGEMETKQTDINGRIAQLQKEAGFTQIDLALGLHKVDTKSGPQYLQTGTFTSNIAARALDPHLLPQERQAYLNYLRTQSPYNIDPALTDTRYRIPKNSAGWGYIEDAKYIDSVHREFKTAKPRGVKPDAYKEVMSAYEEIPEEYIALEDHSADAAARERTQLEIAQAREKAAQEEREAMMESDQPVTRRGTAPRPRPKQQRKDLTRAKAEDYRSYIEAAKEEEDIIEKAKPFDDDIGVYADILEKNGFDKVSNRADALKKAFENRYGSISDYEKEHGFDKLSIAEREARAQVHENEDDFYHNKVENASEQKKNAIKQDKLDDAKAHMVKKPEELAKEESEAVAATQNQLPYSEEEIARLEKELAGVEKYSEKDIDKLQRKVDKSMSSYKAAKEWLAEEAHGTHIEEVEKESPEFDDKLRAAAMSRRDAIRSAVAYKEARKAFSGKGLTDEDVRTMYGELGVSLEELDKEEYEKRHPTDEFGNESDGEQFNKNGIPAVDIRAGSKGHDFRALALHELSHAVGTAALDRSSAAKAYRNKFNEMQAAEKAAGISNYYEHESNRLEEAAADDTALLFEYLFGGDFSYNPDNMNFAHARELTPETGASIRNRLSTMANAFAPGSVIPSSDTEFFKSFGSILGNKIASSKGGLNTMITGKDVDSILDEVISSNVDSIATLSGLDRNAVLRFIGYAPSEINDDDEAKMIAVNKALGLSDADWFDQREVPNSTPEEIDQIESDVFKFEANYLARLKQMKMANSRRSALSGRIAMMKQANAGAQSEQEEFKKAVEEAGKDKDEFIFRSNRRGQHTEADYPYETMSKEAYDDYIARNYIDNSPKGKGIINREDADNPVIIASRYAQLMEDISNLEGTKDNVKSEEELKQLMLVKAEMEKNASAKGIDLAADYMLGQSSQKLMKTGQYADAFGLGTVSSLGELDYRLGTYDIGDLDNGIKVLDTTLATLTTISETKADYEKIKNGKGNFDQEEADEIQADAEYYQKEYAEIYDTVDDQIKRVTAIKEHAQEIRDSKQQSIDIENAKKEREEAAKQERIKEATEASESDISKEQIARAQEEAAKRQATKKAAEEAAKEQATSGIRTVEDVKDRFKHLMEDKNVDHRPTSVTNLEDTLNNEGLKISGLKLAKTPGGETIEINPDAGNGLTNARNYIYGGKSIADVIANSLSGDSDGRASVMGSLKHLSLELAGKSGKNINDVMKDILGFNKGELSYDDTTKNEITDLRGRLGKVGLGGVFSLDKNGVVQMNKHEASEAFDTYGYNPSTAVTEFNRFVGKGGGDALVKQLKANGKYLSEGILFDGQKEPFEVKGVKMRPDVLFQNENGDWTMGDYKSHSGQAAKSIGQQLLYYGAMREKAMDDYAAGDGEKWKKFFDFDENGNITASKIKSFTGFDMSTGASVTADGSTKFTVPGANDGKPMNVEEYSKFLYDQYSTTVAQMGDIASGASPDASSIMQQVLDNILAKAGEAATAAVSNVDAKASLEYATEGVESAAEGMMAKASEGTSGGSGSSGSSGGPGGPGGPGGKPTGTPNERSEADALAQAQLFMQRMQGIKEAAEIGSKELNTEFFKDANMQDQQLSWYRSKTRSLIEVGEQVKKSEEYALKQGKESAAYEAYQEAQDEYQNFNKAYEKGTRAHMLNNINGFDKNLDSIIHGPTDDYDKLIKARSEASQAVIKANAEINAFQQSRLEAAGPLKNADLLNNKEDNEALDQAKAKLKELTDKRDKALAVLDDTTAELIDSKINEFDQAFNDVARDTQSTKSLKDVESKVRDAVSKVETNMAKLEETIVQEAIDMLSADNPAFDPKDKSNQKAIDIQAEILRTGKYAQATAYWKEQEQRVKSGENGEPSIIEQNLRRKAMDAMEADVEDIRLQAMGKQGKYGKLRAQEEKFDNKVDSEIAARKELLTDYDNFKANKTKSSKITEEEYTKIQQEVAALEQSKAQYAEYLRNTTSREMQSDLNASSAKWRQQYQNPQAQIEEQRRLAQEKAEEELIQARELQTQFGGSDQSGKYAAMVQQAEDNLIATLAEDAANTIEGLGKIKGSGNAKKGEYQRMLEEKLEMQNRKSDISDLKYAYSTSKKGLSDEENLAFKRQIAHMDTQEHLNAFAQRYGVSAKDMSALENMSNTGGRRTKILNRLGLSDEQINVLDSLINANAFIDTDEFGQETKRETKDRRFSATAAALRQARSGLGGSLTAEEEYNLQMQEKLMRNAQSQKTLLEAFNINPREMTYDAATGQFAYSGANRLSPEAEKAYAELIREQNYIGSDEARNLFMSNYQNKQEMSALSLEQKVAGQSKWNLQTPEDKLEQERKMAELQAKQTLIEATEMQTKYGGANASQADQARYQKIVDDAQNNLANIIEQGVEQSVAGVHVEGNGKLKQSLQQELDNANRKADISDLKYAYQTSGRGMTDAQQIDMQRQIAAMENEERVKAFGKRYGFDFSNYKAGQGLGTLSAETIAKMSEKGLTMADLVGGFEGGALGALIASGNFINSEDFAKQITRQQANNRASASASLYRQARQGMGAGLSLDEQWDMQIEERKLRAEQSQRRFLSEYGIKDSDYTIDEKGKINLGQGQWDKLDKKGQEAFIQSQRELDYLNSDAAKADLEHQYKIQADYRSKQTDLMIGRQDIQLQRSARQREAQLYGGGMLGQAKQYQMQRQNELEMGIQQYEQQMMSSQMEASKYMTNAGQTKFDELVKGGMSESDAYKEIATLNGQDGNNFITNTAGFDQATTSVEKYAAAIARLKAELSGVSGFQGTLQGMFTKMGTTINSAINRFSTQTLRKAWTEAKKYVTQMDTSMAQTQAITMKSDEQMESVRSSALELASKTHTSATKVAEVQQSLYRQGLSDNEVNERTEQVLQFSAVTGSDPTKAIKQLTTAVKTGLVSSLQEAMDAMVALGDAAATTAEEIAKGLQKSAATAKVSGVSYAELTALLTMGTANTQLGGSQIGNMLNTTMSRIRKVASGDLVTESGKTTSLNDVDTAMKAAGLSLTDDNGNIKDTVSIFREIASVWDGLSDIQKSALSYSLAGTRQSNVFQSYMEAISEDGGEQLDEYIETAESSEGITAKKFEIVSDTISNKITDITNAFDGLVESLGSSDLIKTALGGIADLISNLTSSVGGAGTAVTLGAGLIGGTALATEGVKALTTAAVANPLITAAVAAGVVGLIATISAISNAVDEAKHAEENAAKENNEINQDKVDNATSKYEKLTNAQSNIEQWQDKYGTVEEILNSDDAAEFKRQMEGLAIMFPDLADVAAAAADGTGSFEALAAAIRAASEEASAGAEKEKIDAINNVNFKSLGDASVAKSAQGLTTIKVGGQEYTIASGYSAENAVTGMLAGQGYKSILGDTSLESVIGHDLKNKNVTLYGQTAAGESKYEDYTENVTAEKLIDMYYDYLITGEDTTGIKNNLATYFGITDKDLATLESYIAQEYVGADIFSGTSVKADAQTAADNITGLIGGYFDEDTSEYLNKDITSWLTSLDNDELASLMEQGEKAIWEAYKNNLGIEGDLTLESKDALTDLLTDKYGEQIEIGGIKLAKSGATYEDYLAGVEEYNAGIKAQQETVEMPTLELENLDELTAKVSELDTAAADAATASDEAAQAFKDATEQQKAESEEIEKLTKEAGEKADAETAAQTELENAETDLAKKRETAAENLEDFNKKNEIYLEAEKQYSEAEEKRSTIQSQISELEAQGLSVDNYLTSDQIQELRVEKAKLESDKEEIQAKKEQYASTNAAIPYMQYQQALANGKNYTEEDLTAAQIKLAQMETYGVDDMKDIYDQVKLIEQIQSFLELKKQADAYTSSLESYDHQLEAKDNEIYAIDERISNSTGTDRLVELYNQLAEVDSDVATKFTEYKEAETTANEAWKKYEQSSEDVKTAEATVAEKQDAYDTAAAIAQEARIALVTAANNGVTEEELAALEEAAAQAETNAATAQTALEEAQTELATAQDNNATAQAAYETESAAAAAKQSELESELKTAMSEEEYNNLYHAKDMDVLSLAETTAGQTSDYVSAANRSLYNDFAAYVNQFDDLEEFTEAINSSWADYDKYSEVISTSDIATTIANINNGTASYGDLVDTVLNSINSLTTDAASLASNIADKTTKQINNQSAQTYLTAYKNGNQYAFSDNADDIAAILGVDASVVNAWDNALIEKLLTYYTEDYSQEKIDDATEYVNSAIATFSSYNNLNGRSDNDSDIFSGDVRKYMQNVYDAYVKDKGEDANTEEMERIMTEMDYFGYNGKMKYNIEKQKIDSANATSVAYDEDGNIIAIPTHKTWTASGVRAGTVTVDEPTVWETYEQEVAKEAANLLYEERQTQSATALTDKIETLITSGNIDSEGALQTFIEGLSEEELKLAEDYNDGEISTILAYLANGDTESAMRLITSAKENAAVSTGTARSKTYSSSEAQSLATAATTEDMITAASALATQVSEQAGAQYLLDKFDRLSSTEMESLASYLGVDVDALTRGGKSYAETMMSYKTSALGRTKDEVNAEWMAKLEEKGIKVEGADELERVMSQISSGEYEFGAEVDSEGAKELADAYEAAANSAATVATNAQAMAEALATAQDTLDTQNQQEEFSAWLEQAKGHYEDLESLKKDINANDVFTGLIASSSDMALAMQSATGSADELIAALEALCNQDWAIKFSAGDLDTAAEDVFGSEDEIDEYWRDHNENGDYSYWEAQRDVLRANMLELSTSNSALYSQMNSRYSMLDTLKTAGDKDTWDEAYAQYQAQKNIYDWTDMFGSDTSLSGLSSNMESYFTAAANKDEYGRNSAAYEIAKQGVQVAQAAAIAEKLAAGEDLTSEEAELMQGFGYDLASKSGINYAIKQSRLNAEKWDSLDWTGAGMEQADLDYINEYIANNTATATSHSRDRLRLAAESAMAGGTVDWSKFSDEDIAKINSMYGTYTQDGKDYSFMDVYGDTTTGFTTLAPDFNSERAMEQFKRQQKADQAQTDYDAGRISEATYNAIKNVTSLTGTESDEATIRGWRETAEQSAATYRKNLQTANTYDAWRAQYNADTAAGLTTTTTEGMANYVKEFLEGQGKDTTGLGFEDMLAMADELASTMHEDVNKWEQQNKDAAAVYNAEGIEYDADLYSTEGTVSALEAAVAAFVNGDAGSDTSLQHLFAQLIGESEDFETLTDTISRMSPAMQEFFEQLLQASGEDSALKQFEEGVINATEAASLYADEAGFGDKSKGEYLTNVNSAYTNLRKARYYTKSAGNFKYGTAVTDAQLEKASGTQKTKLTNLKEQQSEAAQLLGFSSYEEMLKVYDTADKFYDAMEKKALQYQREFITTANSGDNQFNNATLADIGGSEIENGIDLGTVQVHYGMEVVVDESNVDAIAATMDSTQAALLKNTIAEGGSITLSLEDLGYETDQDENGNAIDLHKGWQWHWEGYNATGSVNTVGGSSGSTSAGSSNSSGGGGGGGKSSADKLIEKWKNKIAVNEHRVKMIQKEENMYKNRGEYTNQLAMMEYEVDEQKLLKSNYNDAIKELKAEYAKTVKKEGADDEDAIKLRDQIMA